MRYSEINTIYGNVANFFINVSTGKDSDTDYAEVNNSLEDFDLNDRDAIDLISDGCLQGLVLNIKDSEIKNFKISLKRGDNRLNDKSIEFLRDMAYSQSKFVNRSNIGNFVTIYFFSIDFDNDELIFKIDSKVISNNNEQ